ncbi:MAG: 2-succinyl-5-enolpyruvyl-6-hydroxy-3-cyclohexene-1-carboxylate synthase, partial [Actinomycetota bacterium]
ACRAAAVAAGSPPGPVHLNFAFREPLLPGPDAPTFPFGLGGRAGGLPWTETVRAPRHLPEEELERLGAAITSAERGLILAGDAPVDADAVHALARASGWPVIADPLSGARCGELAISMAEALLRHPGFVEAHQPDLVLRLGRSASSRTLAAFLDPAVPQVVIDPDGPWADPERAARRVVVADPSAACEALAKAVAGRAGSPWLRAWLDAEAAAREAVDELLDGWDDPSEPRAARDLCRALPDGAALVVASSMPVREVDWFMRPRRGLRVIGNRGASGIDGFVSTALGVALAHDGPTAGLAGDLSLIHDQNGLQLARRGPVACVFVVLNNDGGAIFSFLPYAGLPEFERLFGTPHGIAPADIAKTFGCGHSRVERMPDLSAAIQAAFDAGGVHLVELRTDRTANVEHHRRLWAVVATRLDAIGP